MFQLGKQAFIFTVLLLTVSCLKPSEVGVNDWAINTIGEVQNVVFTKNKVYFKSTLNSLGIIDKYNGQLLSRASIAEGQRVLGEGDMTLNIATRYGQVVSHYFTATGLDKNASNNFRVENRTLQWILSFDENDYFVTKNSFHLGKQLIKEAENGQNYLRLVRGSTNRGYIVYIISKYIKDNKICIQSYLDVFINTYCIENISEELTDLQFYEEHLVVGFNSSTYLLSESLELVHLFEERLVEVVNGVLILYNKVFSIKEKTFLDRRPIRSERKDVEIYMKQLTEGIAVFRQNFELFFIAQTRNTHVLRAWFNFKTEMDYDLVIQYTDLEFAFYTISRGDAQLSWKREESLAHVQDVVFLKYFQTDTLDNQYHKHLLSHSYKGLTLAQKLTKVPTDFLLRLKQQIIDIQYFLLESINYIIIHLANFDSKSIQKFLMSPQQEIKYGLRKYLVFATKYNTLIAIDSKQKHNLWKINRNNKNRLIKLVHLKRDFETEIAVLITYSEQEATTYVEEINEKGETKLLASYQEQQEPLVYKLNDHKLAIKFGDKIERFSLLEEDELPEKEFYFYTQESNQIKGWKVVGKTVVRIWNFRTQGAQHIIKVASAFRGDQRSHIPLFDREKVFFKNVDFTNLAVLTSFNKTDVALYIINGRTGKIHFNTFRNSISLNLPINLVYDQNNVLVSYYNHKNKNFEIWTVEQYQERIQTSALSMIKDYINDNRYKPQESKQKTIFEEEVFGSPVSIKNLYVSESKMSLVRRNLFVITRENKLYTINRDYVSTRRPKKNAVSFFANQKFPEYTYFIPFAPSSYLSYYLNLANLNKIEFNPTDMQSTIFTLCYGTDIFLVRNAPDKAFDMITEDFNHVVLILILIAATIGITFFQRIMNAAKLKKAHLD